LNSFRNRLTFTIVALIAMSVIIAGIFMTKTFKENNIAAIEENMAREIRIIGANMEWVTGELSEISSYYTEKALEMKSYTDARVTFIRHDGIVLGDSDGDALTMENHLDREEIREAFESGVGRAVRASETTNQNLIYVALPISFQENEQPKFIRLSMSLSSIDQSIRETTAVIFAGLLVLFLTAAIISFRIAHGMTKPLEDITKVAQRIKNMDYRARVQIKKHDEIGELGHAINAMADSLYDQMTKIQQNEHQLTSVLENMINGIMMIDQSGSIMVVNRRAEEIFGITAAELVGGHYSKAKQQYELTRLIQECFESRTHLHDEINVYYPEERLLEVNVVPVHANGIEFTGILLVLQDVSDIRRLERMRSEFVANVSHELKTPIAAVKGFSETLLSGAVKDEETAKSFLQIINDESDRLNRLIGDILELSKIESRRVPLIFSPIELDLFMSKLIKLLQAEAIRKNITIELDVEQGLHVEADEDRLRQIIMNLLSNGINYTPEGGKVSIKVNARGEDHIGFIISDTGIGIPKKDLSRIFERFYRVDKARSRSSGGTGLGLSIVKHLVELHKGTITVTSTVGAGTTFTLELPVLQ